MPTPNVGAAKVAKLAYEKRWLNGPPSEEIQNASVIETLRSHFWGHKDALPRCYACRKGNAKMAPSGTGPNGTEDVELLPCGCEYENSMLELWLSLKGLWDTDEPMPKAFGKHSPCARAMFEILLGRFSIEKMLNFGNDRVDACGKAAREESRTAGVLKPHPHFD